MCHIPFEVALIRLSFIEMTGLAKKSLSSYSEDSKNESCFFRVLLLLPVCMMSLELEAINDNDLGRLPAKL